jgi:hypothetical protein
MVLRQILRELERSSGPVCLNDLSRKLGVEPGALEGMISFLERKGRLKKASGVAPVVCSSPTELDDTYTSCSVNCQEARSCPLAVKGPLFTTSSASSRDS